MRNLILEEQIARQLSDRWLVRAFDSCSSTMNEARDLLSSHSHLKNALLIAKQQESGRGRQGRVWLNARDALLVTYVFALSIPLELIQAAPLVVGLTVSDLCDELGCKTRLKWPNDVLSTDGKKLAGVLLELVTEGSSSCLLIGIGLNIKGAPMKEASSLESLGVRDIDSMQLGGKLALRIESALTTLIDHGFTSLRTRWLDKAFGLGQAITTHQGTKAESGIFEGLSERGYLLLRQGDKLREVHSGEVGLELCNR